MSRGGKVTRRYKHNTQILQQLSSATGLSQYSLKRMSQNLCMDLGAEFPTMTIEEWKRRYLQHA